MSSFKFGIMGAASIAYKFCDAVKLLDGIEVSAVASRSEERAKKFAQDNSIPMFFGDNETMGGYERMLNEARPDAVYISTTMETHAQLTELCINYGVPVLCEKSMFTCQAEADRVLPLAKEKGVFVMEAMWSRFLPPMQKAKEWIKEGRIGKVKYIEGSIGFIANKDPNARYFNPKLGGGAALDLLVYPYELSTYMTDGEVSDVKLNAVFAETGVDTTENVTMKIGDVLASLSASIDFPADERLAIFGDNGRIVLPNIHFASEAVLYDKDKRETERFKDTETKNGFTYEAAEAVRCIKEGLLESPMVPHKLSRDFSKVVDMIYKERR